MKYQLSEKQLRRVGESGNFLSAINFLKGLLEKYQGLFFCLELDLEFVESECIVSRQSSKQCKWEISAGDVFFEQLHPYWTPVDYYDSYSYIQFTSLFSKNCISSFTNTFFLHQKSFICCSFLFLALQISLISVGKATVWLIGSISSGVRSYRLKENTHWHDINPVTFPSWASLMAFPVDVVLRRLFPPNVLRPDIRLVRPTGPWAGPPGGGPPTDAAAAGPTVRPSSSVTKKVDHMLWRDGKQLRQSSEFGSWACFELFPRRGRKQKLKTGTKTEENCCVLSVCAH